MNIFLMDVYDEYMKNKTINTLEEFTKKTFPSDGTDKVFIGCVLILINSVYKTRLSAETLYSVVLSGKEKLKSTHLLKFYMSRVNRNKLISKYLSKVVDDEDFDKYVDLILEYLEERSFDFTNSIKNQYKNKIEKYIETI